MSKILRLLTVSLLLAGIMIATIGAGAVFAQWGGDVNGNEPDTADQDRLRDGSCNDTCDGDGPWWLTE